MAFVPTSAGASTLACDFLTIETLALQRIYVLFFLSLATRRLEFIACTANPGGAWVAQQNEHRPHRALQLAPPDGSNSTADGNTCAIAALRRRDLLGGLIHEYQRAA